MGITLELYVEDESLEGIHFSKAFKEEVIYSGYLNFSDFLNTEETTILTPNELGSITIGQKKPFKTRDKLKLLTLLYKFLVGKKSSAPIHSVLEDYWVTSGELEDRERDPKALKEALKKVEQEFIKQEAILPLVHYVYEEANREEEIDFLEVKGIAAHVEGDLFFYDHYATTLRDKIWVKSYGEDYEKINLKIKVEPEIQINNQTFYTKTITKAQQFAEEFQQVYAFLNLATTANKKVLLEYF